MPLVTDKKMNCFSEEVLGEAKRRSRTILEETDKRRAEMLKNGENALLAEIYDDIRTESQNIRVEFGQKVNARRSDCRREMSDMIDSFTDRILAAVGEKIGAFTSSDQYPVFLKDTAESVLAELGGPFTVLCAPRDEAKVRDLAASLCAKFGSNAVAAVCADSSLEKGGLIFRDDERGILVDESLDARLAHQRESILHLLAPVLKEAEQ